MEVLNGTSETQEIHTKKKNNENEIKKHAVKLVKKRKNHLADFCVFSIAHQNTDYRWVRSEKNSGCTQCAKTNLVIEDSDGHLKEIGKHRRFVVEQDVGVTQRWAERFVNWSRTKLGGTIVWNRVEQGGTLSKLAGTSAGASWNSFGNLTTDLGPFRRRLEL